MFYATASQGFRPGGANITPGVPASNQVYGPDTLWNYEFGVKTQFLNHKGGQTYQSIPVCAFYTRDLEYLYHFTEYAAIYDKDRVVV